MTRKAAAKPLNSKPVGQRPRGNGQATAAGNPYTQSEQDLEQALFRAFGEGLERLEIKMGKDEEGRDRTIIVTREEWFEAKNHATPEQQFLPLATRVLKVASRKYTVDYEKHSKMQAAFLQKLSEASIVYIDPDDPPGTDANGKKFDISGKMLVPPHKYPSSAAQLEGEVGTLMDELMTQQFIRLVAVKPKGAANDAATGKAS